MIKIEIHGITSGPKIHNIKEKIKEAFKDKHYRPELRIEVYPTAETDLDGNQHSCFRLIANDPTIQGKDAPDRIEGIKQNQEIKQTLHYLFPDMHIEHFYQHDYLAARNDEIETI